MMIHRDRRATTPWPSLRLAPYGGRPEKGAGGVAALVRATSPPCAPLLAGALLRAILVIAGYQPGPSARFRLD